MVSQKERTHTRSEEPEPVGNYEQLLEYFKSARDRVHLPHVTKSTDVPWQIGRNGTSKYYSSPFMNTVLPDWYIFRKTIRDKNGRHTHQGGLIIFGLYGEGESLVDDERVPWGEGDLLILPVKPGGVEHQHFNMRGPDDPAEWLAMVDIPFLELLGAQLTQNETYSEWQEKHAHMMAADDFEDYKDEYDQVSDLFGGFNFDNWLDYEPPSPDSVKTYYDASIIQRDNYRKMVAKARKAGNWALVRGKDLEWEINPQGKMKWYLHPAMEDRSVISSMFAVQEIPPGSRSGKQHRQGGQVHYILEGKGYTEISGPRYEGTKRFDWAKKAYFGIPVVPEGLAVQHFNDDPENPAIFIVSESSRYLSLGFDLGSGFEQLENCPEYDALDDSEKSVTI